MLLELWLQALASEIGISIETDNRRLLRQHLYRARAEANNPELDDLVMLLPEKDDEIWLVHKNADEGLARASLTVISGPKGSMPTD